MLTLIITNNNKARIAVRCYLLHKMMNGFDIFFFYLFTQIRNKRNFFRLYFSSGAHLLI